MKNNFTFQIDVLRSKELIKKGDWVILGYATTYDLKEDGLQITKEALTSAKDDLLKYSTVLFNHNPDRPIGKIVETDVDDVGLIIKMVLSKEEEEIWNKVQDGTITKFSIQGRIVESKPIGKDSSKLQVTKINLFEAGLVSTPGDVESKTISWWIARSLNKQASNVNMNFIEKLKKIKDKSPDDLKEELDVLISEMSQRNNVIEQLQLLAGKADEENKDALDYAISFLKREEEKPEEEKEDDKTTEESEYNLSDESKDRPVFQVNVELSDDDTLEKNVFRKQILKIGKWYHWGAPGGILEVTDKVVANIAKNFKQKILDHVFVPLSHTNDPSKNAGEVLKLIKTKDGLDAVIEIKDKNVVEKIQQGLIKSISASLDSNYFVSKKNKFVGPTMLHAALVAEPFIKGMGNFIPLSDEHSERTIIQLEDGEPDFNKLMGMIKETLTTLQENLITEDKMKKIIKEAVKKEGEPCTLDDGTKGTYQEKEGELVCIAEPEEEEKEEAKETLKDDDTEKIEEDVEKEEVKENKEDEVKEEIIEKKEDKEEGDKEKYEKCVGDCVKEGMDLGDAIKKCVKEIELSKSTSEDKTGDQPEEESEEDAKTESEEVDLSDSEGIYERYLKAGKIVPAQKEAFIQILAAGKVLNLGDKQVDLSKLIESFMESQSKVVNFSEEGTTGNDGIQNKESEIPEEVKDFYGKMGLSDDAIKESYDYAREMKKQEKEQQESTLL